MTRVASSPVYEMHGLRVRSPIPLGVPGGDHLTADIEVTGGEPREVPSHPPAGNLIREVSFPNGVGSACSRTHEGYHLRFYATCDFTIDPALRTIETHPDPHADGRLVGPLLEGSVLAFLLAMAGDCVLHASAVEVAGRAVALVGTSGQGKTTLATLLCRKGARLVTDDVLRVDLSGVPPRCYSGGRTIRLRSAATALLEGLPAGSVTRTVDDRFATDLAEGRSSRPELHAIVIPHPSRTVGRLRLQRFDTVPAFLALSRYPRVIGWRARDPLCAQFKAYTRLATQVPVYRADVPWGPPFDPGVASELLALCVTHEEPVPPL